MHCCDCGGVSECVVGAICSCDRAVIGVRKCSVTKKKNIARLCADVMV